METFTGTIATSRAALLAWDAVLTGMEVSLYFRDGSETILKLHTTVARIHALMIDFPDATFERFVDLAAGLSLEAAPVVDVSAMVLEQDFTLSIDGRTYTAR